MLNGFLDRLANQFKQFDYAPSHPQALPCFIATTSCCPTDSTVISYRLGTSQPYLFNISFRGSVVPYAIALHTALAVHSDPLAAFSPATGRTEGGYPLLDSHCQGSLECRSNSQTPLGCAYLHFDMPAFTSRTDVDSYGSSA
jgi:hypothetical protein